MYISITCVDCVPGEFCCLELWLSWARCPQALHAGADQVEWAGADVDQGQSGSVALLSKSAMARQLKLWWVQAGEADQRLTWQDIWS